MQITKDESGHILKIAGALEIGMGEDLQDALRDFVCQESRPIIDLSEVEACDTAVLQLLYSTHKTAERAKKPLEIVGLSAAIRNASAALGLSFPEVPA